MVVGRWVRRLAVVLVMLALPFCSVLHTADASLVPRGDVYLHRSDGALADPVNLIFIAANGDEAAAAVERVLGWQPTGGSELLFWRAGEPALEPLQLGLSLGHGDRYHMRIEARHDESAGEVYAGVHHDVRAACGHLGREFDAMRDDVAASFADAGYAVSRIDLGNTAPSRQCDGSFSSGDGVAAVIDLGSAPALHHASTSSERGRLEYVERTIATWQTLMTRTNGPAALPTIGTGNGPLPALA